MKSLEIVNLYLEELELHECKEMWLYRTSMQQIKQDLEKLKKLEKAFEILKDAVDLENGFWDEVQTIGETETRYFCRMTISLDKEEYELLEELMRDAKD